MAKVQPDHNKPIGAGNEPRSSVSEAAIAQRAYELYLEHGGQDGHDIDDWLEAERLLKAEYPD